MPILSMPRMILFDYGQTLIDEEPFDPLKGNAALVQAACSNPQHVTPERLQQLAGELSQEISAAFSHVPRDRQPLEITSKAFDHYLYAYFGIELPENCEEIFWDAAAPGKPAPHVKRLLAYLRDVHIPIAVVSNMMNSVSSLQRRLDKLLPGFSFSFVLTSGDYMFRKPHPRLFELALRRAALSPEQVWYCGDNPVCDIEGAYRAGIQPVWYKPPSAAHQKKPSVPHIVIEDWDELIATLHTLT